MQKECKFVKQRIKKKQKLSEKTRSNQKMKLNIYENITKHIKYYIFSVSSISFFVCSIRDCAGGVVYTNSNSNILSETILLIPILRGICIVDCNFRQ